MPEHQNIEYKSIWKDEYLKWICGFANAAGGKIYIGVNDDGKAIRVEKIKKLSEDIPNKIYYILGILVDVNVLTDEETGNEYIEISVEPHPYPVNYKGQYYYRSGSTKQELKGAALNKFILERMGKRWDSIPLPKVSIDDLSLAALQRFRKEAKESRRVDQNVLNDSAEHLMQDLQLMDEETGYLKRAAILLFHPKPEKYVTGAYLKIGFFKSDVDLVFQDEVHGSIMEQLDKALDLLTTKYINYAISYEGFSRKETPTFPVAALRETLLNSVAHKDYSDGTPIQISVYPGHIVFWNPGKLPDHWTPEYLLSKHPSRPYNPDIANALFRSGDIEAWGRGFRQIIESTMEQKLLPPVIDNRMGVMLTYYTDARVQLATEGVEENLIPVIQYVLSNGSINNTQVQKLLNISKPTATRILKQLEFWLQRKGTTGKGTSYVLKWQA